jgi:hypothetical protein
VHMTLSQVPEDSEFITTATHRVGRKVPDIYVRGLHENEIFDQVRPHRCDRVHWDTVGPLDVQQILTHLVTGQSLVTEAFTRQWSDGQHRIWVPVGQGDVAREEIRALCLAQNVEAVNLRIERDVPFRDLNSLDPALLGELISSCVEWLYPRSFSIRQRVTNELDGVDQDDLKGMMYLFVHDLADRFDSQRRGRNGTLNFMAFVLGKLKTWPQDLARATYGRSVIEDRVALARLQESLTPEVVAGMSDLDRADALGVSVTELRRKENSIAQLAHVRRPNSISGDFFDDSPSATTQVADDSDVAEEVIVHNRNVAITKAIIDAVNDPSAQGRKTQDPLALAATYLTFWEGLGRAEVARQLGVMPKTVAAAVERTLAKVELAKVEPAEYRDSDSE